MMLWTVDPAERDAKLVDKALRRKDDNFALRKADEHYIWVIVEVACASSPDHLMAVRKAYCSKFSSSLEEDVASCSYKDPIRQVNHPASVEASPNFQNFKKITFKHSAIQDIRKMTARAKLLSS